MESCPDYVNVAEVYKSIKDQNNVTDVEHLHIYATSFDRVVLMANILISTCELEHEHEAAGGFDPRKSRQSSEEFSCIEVGYAEKAARAGQRVSNMIMLKFPQIH